MGFGIGYGIAAKHSLTSVMAASFAALTEIKAIAVALCHLAW
jgi:hypothetical protein